MRHQRFHTSYFFLGICLAAWLGAAPLLSQEEKKAAKQQELSPRSIMTEDEWKEVDQSVDRALTWLATQQRPDGSFPSIQRGQPGVTGLCMLAFMSQGHLPGAGKYGEQLKRALDYIVECQTPNGIIAASAPRGEKISRFIDHQTGYTVVYNHAISGLVLSECYAMAGPEQTEKAKPAIEKALAATGQMQDFRKDRKVDEGGWRYLDDADNVDADLSISGWHLMFLRSAKNAGFDVDEKRITNSVDYVRRCFLKDRGTFTYKAGYPTRPSRGVAGSGILALAHSGLHETREAQQAGDWILKSGFESYNNIGKVKDIVHQGDRYHYGLLTCSQAMYQLGGRHWREFFPPASRVLIDNQKADGSWHPEKMHVDGIFGNAYTTAASVIALNSSNELLPIFQR